MSHPNARRRKRPARLGEDHARPRDSAPWAARRSAGTRSRKGWRTRSLRRGGVTSARRAHADPGPDGQAAFVRQYHAFGRLAMDAPSIEVGITDAYRPALDRIVEFASG